MAEKHNHLYRCLGEVISTRRKQLGMSQKDLSQKSGVDRVFISNLEQGKRKPSFGAIHDIAQGLRLKYSRFVGKCEQCVEESA